MSEQQWIGEGADDDQSRRPTMPGFLEVAPDEYRNIDDCTTDELATAG